MKKNCLSLMVFLVAFLGIAVSGWAQHSTIFDEQINRLYTLHHHIIEGETTTYEVMLDITDSGTCTTPDSDFVITCEGVEDEGNPVVIYSAADNVSELRFAHDAMTGTSYIIYEIGSAVNVITCSTASIVPTYSISGVVSGSGAGTTVSLSGAATAQTTTGSDGSYSFTGLANGSYTVTPSKAGYVFTPSSRAVTITSGNQSGIDFSGTIPTYSISGVVSGSGAGTTVSLSGAATAQTTTGSDGSYSFTGLASGSYTVTPSKAGYTFTPPSQSVTVSGANASGINFTGTSSSGTADLIVSKFSPPTAGRNNLPFSASVEVKNQGTSSAGAFKVKIYLSSNTVLNSGDTLLYTHSVSGLAAGATLSFTAGPMVVTGCIVHSYSYLFAVVDADSEVSEVNESNNVFMRYFYIM